MAAGGRRRAGFFPLVLVVMTGLLVSGMLVAWRRLDAAHQQQPARPGFYEPQVFNDQQNVRRAPKGGGGGTAGSDGDSGVGEEEAAETTKMMTAAASEPYKTLVIYVYHEG